AGPPVFEQPKIDVLRPDSDEVEGAGKGAGTRSKSEGKGAAEGKGAGDGKGAAAGKAEGGKGDAKTAKAAGARAVGGTGGQAPRAPSAVEVEFEELGIPEHDEDGKPLTLPKRMALAKEARERKRRGEAAALSAQEETMRSGAEDMPGRVIRIRGL